MNAYRMAKGVTEHYTSLEDLRAAWGCKPITKQTKDKEKLKKQREDFCNRHLCPACKNPMTYVNGMNVLVCKNEKCLGIKHEVTTNTGETKVFYSPAFDLLDEKAYEISENIFAEYE